MGRKKRRVEGRKMREETEEISVAVQVRRLLVTRRLHKGSGEKGETKVFYQHIQSFLFGWKKKIDLAENGGAAVKFGGTLRSGGLSQ